MKHWWWAAPLAVMIATTWFTGFMAGLGLSLVAFIFTAPLAGMIAVRRPNEPAIPIMTTYIGFWIIVLGLSYCSYNPDKDSSDEGVQYRGMEV